VVLFLNIVTNTLLQRRLPKLPVCSTDNLSALMQSWSF